jgi:hypothetical protein
MKRGGKGESTSIGCSDTDEYGDNHPIYKTALYNFGTVSVNVFSAQFDEFSELVFPVPKYGVQVSGPNRTGHITHRLHKFASVSKTSPSRPSLDYTEKM